ncbi:MAG TPA: SRPBCC family protein [Chloroflexia bacterium]|nr:SRPBCC family protein [Chloroflexia bacterium]
MIKVSTSTTIARPADQVFAYLADVTKQPEWEPTVLACRLNSSEPMREGSTATQTMKDKESKRDVTLTVAEYEVGRRIQFEKQWPYPISFGWVIEPNGSGTQVTYLVELGVQGMMRALLSVMRVLSALGLKTPIHRDLNNIKKRIEESN